jgi:hypothetical protein
MWGVEDIEIWMCEDMKVCKCGDVRFEGVEM